MKQLYVLMVMAVMSALVVTNSGTTTTKPTTTSRKPWTTTGFYGQNLNGKMFTLSRDGGGIYFYPPGYSPWFITTPYPTRRYTTRRYFTTTTPKPTTTTPRPRPTTTTPKPTTTTPRPIIITPRPTTTTPKPTTTTPRPTTTTPKPTTTTPKPTTTTPKPTTTTTYPPWTTAPPTRGVSVCLRYLTDYSQSSDSTIFKLSPSGSNTLMLSSSYSGVYTLSYGYSYYSMYFRPNIMLWSNIQPDIWTRVCVTVDTVKRVAQVFNGSTVSIRKLLPYQYVWSGEPVIDFSGFDGQFTDVQVWNYPLNYKEIYNYMTSGGYGWYHGSVLTWSSINYSPRGYTLLEDVYERQAKQPIRSRGKGNRPKGEKKTREFVYVEGWKERQQL